MNVMPFNETKHSGGVLKSPPEKKINLMYTQGLNYNRSSSQ